MVISMFSLSLRNAADSGQQSSARLLVLVGAHHFGAQHRLVEAQLAVELGYRSRLGLQVDNDVDAFGVLGDLVRQPTPAPDVDLVDFSAVFSDNVQERLQGRSNGALVERGVKNDHDFVWTHGNLTSSGLCGHGRSVAGASPASATVLGYRTWASLRNPRKSRRSGQSVFIVGLGHIRRPWPSSPRLPSPARPNRMAAAGRIR